MKTVSNYNILLRELPINELLTSTELAPMDPALVNIFTHLKKLQARPAACTVVFCWFAPSLFSHLTTWRCRARATRIRWNAQPSWSSRSRATSRSR
jgi:hypothetical protein